MKTKLIAAIITVFILCNVASAQDYDIRIEHYTNLRASHSVQSAIIETAPAGTILQVIGSVNRWLRINRNGNEVWMASWVGHTRVQGSEETVSQPANNIDNCCFVDRQCNSDQQWTDGYWAFQNGQCTAQEAHRLRRKHPYSPRVAVPLKLIIAVSVDRQCATMRNGQMAIMLSRTINAPCRINLRRCGPPAMAYRSHCQWGPTRLSPWQPLISTIAVIWILVAIDAVAPRAWQRGYLEYQNHQCLHPTPIGTRPAIVGDASGHLPIWSKMPWN